MRPRIFSKLEVEEKHFIIWNAFIDLIGLGKYDDLTDVQRPAHLVFLYESEVQNGGHLQYFENKRLRYLPETLVALGTLGAESQRLILREASEAFLSRERQRIQTVEQYCETALEGEFHDLDSRFYRCTPSLEECLKAYLARHQSSFVTIV